MCSFVGSRICKGGLWAARRWLVAGELLTGLSAPAAALSSRCVGLLGDLGARMQRAAPPVPPPPPPPGGSGCVVAVARALRRLTCSSEAAFLDTQLFQAGYALTSERGGMRNDSVGGMLHTGDVCQHLEDCA